MAPRGDDEAVRRVLEEARSDRPAEVDWDRMEQSLLATAGAGSERPGPPERSRPPYVLLATAAACILLAGAVWRLVAGTHALAPVAVEQRVVGPNATGRVDGDSLKVGDRVVAANEAVHVEHQGRASWTLAPDSVAAIAVVGELLTIELEKGRLLAEVVPGVGPESFAVEVGETRVAVKGTVFRVERRGEDVLVEVSSGTVAVGSNADRGSTRGWLLEAPARGTFSLDGARRGEVRRDRTSTSRRGAGGGDEAPASGRTAARSRTGTSKRVGADATSGPPGTRPSDELELPAVPAKAALVRTADELATITGRCFDEHTTTRKGMRVSATTRLSIDLGADGRVTAIRFDPPLAPAVQRCVGKEMTKVRGPRSRLGGTIDRAAYLGG